MTQQAPENQAKPKPRASECKPLLAAATPEVFLVNAFRITGLPVDATAREITRHADKLKMMEELGQGKSVHTGAFALKNPPSVDQIRDAIQRLKDPEQRIVDEFFWFWPTEFGKGASDPAIQALNSGDADKALEIWTSLETNPSDGVVAMHNVAVLWHLLALEWENHYAKKGGLPDEKRRETERLWRGAFKRWELLAADDYFWEKVTVRIKQLDDPRLTTGFTRRMRASLPFALDKINAELAVRYAESGRMDLARQHVQFMRETNEGLDDVEQTAELVLAPAAARLRQLIQRAKERSAKNPNDALNVARELLEHAGQTLSLFDLFFGKESDARNELSDEVAATCNRLQLDYHKATGDDKACLAILKLILPLAASNDLRRLIEKNISVTLANAELDPIRTICEDAAEAVEADPASGERQAQRILSGTASLLQRLPTSGLPQDVINQAKDEVALALLHCAVAYGNKTDNWKPCIEILEKSLHLAVSTDIKARVTKNLDTVRANNRVFGGLSPISSAPSLHTVNGIGFALYGCTDQDSATGSYLATYYFVLLAIPIFPICRYRVAPTGNGYRFFGKAPLRTFDKWHLAISLGLILWLIIALNSSGSARKTYSSRPSTSASTSRTSYAPTYTAPSTYTPPASSDASDVGIYRVPHSRTADLSRDRQAVEAAKAESERYSQQLENLASEIERDRLYLNRSSQFAVEEFNDKVNRHNALLEQQRARDRAVNRMVDDYNTKLRLYSR